jgi:hypothetical protein
MPTHKISDTLTDTPSRASNRGADKEIAVQRAAIAVQMTPIAVQMTEIAVQQALRTENGSIVPTQALPNHEGQIIEMRVSGLRR